VAAQSPQRGAFGPAGEAMVRYASRLEEQRLAGAPP